MNRKINSIVIGLLLIGQAHAQPTSINCGTDIVAAGNYILNGNQTPTNGDCIYINTNTSGSIDLDLGGFTITYDNQTSGVPNPGFEAGTGNSPDNWTVSSSTDVKRIANTYSSAYEGDYHLEFSNTSGSPYIESPWVALPLNRVCSVSWVSEVALTGTVKVEADGGGTLLDTSLSGSSINTFTTHASIANHKFRMTITSGTAPVEVDMLDLRTDENYGIKVNTPNATQVKIHDGWIIQGAGKGTRAHGIWALNGKNLIVGGATNDSVRVSAYGMRAFAINFVNGKDSQISYCNLRAMAPLDWRRQDLAAAVYVTSTSSKRANIHHNLVNTGTGLGGITVSGFPGHAGRHKIENNTVNVGTAVTNHHGIISFDCRASLIRNNIVNATYAQGIDVGGACDSTEVSGNTITLTGIKPAYTGGWISFDAIRLNDYGMALADSVYVHDNTIYLYGGAHPAYPTQYRCGDIPQPNSPSTACNGKVLNGIMSFLWGRFNRYVGNIINVSINDDSIFASCIETGRTPDSITPANIFENNTCNSNQKMVAIGGYAQRADNITFKRNTFNKVTPSIGHYRTLTSRGTDSGITASRFLGSILQNGASFNESGSFVNTYMNTAPYCEQTGCCGSSGGTPPDCAAPYSLPPCTVPGCTERCHSGCSTWITSGYNFSQEWFLDVRVITSGGQPINNAFVTVQNVFNQDIFTGYTGADGWIQDIECKDWVRTGSNFSNTGTTTSHTAHRVKADVAPTWQYITMTADQTITLSQTISCCPGKPCCEEIEGPEGGN